MYKLIYTGNARQDLKNLELQISQTIIKKINFYMSSPNPLSFAKKLQNSPLGSYRFRIGDYRAIFDLDHQGNINILMILRIKHRKDVYKD